MVNHFQTLPDHDQPWSLTMVRLYSSHRGMLEVKSDQVYLHVTMKGKQHSLQAVNFYITACPFPEINLLSWQSVHQCCEMILTFKQHLLNTSLV